MQDIKIKGELLFELKDKQDWINRVPKILPNKNRANERFIWVDVNGHVFECGGDFMYAEKHNTYPCKVYRVKTVEQWATEKESTNGN